MSKTYVYFDECFKDHVITLDYPGLIAMSLSTAPAVAGSCGGGNHTHTTEDTKKEKGAGI